LDSTGTATKVQPNATTMRLGDFIELMRPAQWVKNVVVFAAPAASLKLFAPESFLHAWGAFLAFCLAASATYAVNDVVDREADASHPTKRNRPIARGAIKPTAAVLFAVFLFAAGIATAVWAAPSVGLVVTAYVILTLSYSWALKKRVLLDVIIIATGFVLRAWAGSLAVGVETSEWLVACMFTLCLFLGFGKRRCEQTMIGSKVEAGQHRATLLRYTPELLNHLITVSAGIAVVTFLLYTLDGDATRSPFPREDLFYTLPIVVYGIFRFAMLSETGRYSGPTEIVLKDKAMLLTIGAWATAALLIAYQERLFGEGGLSAWLQRF